MNKFLSFLSIVLLTTGTAFAGSAFFQLKRDWHAECEKIQKTPPTVFGN